MTDILPIHEWVVKNRITTPPPKPSGPEYKVKCKNCGYIITVGLNTPFCSLCPCGSRIVHLTDDGKGVEEYYSSRNLI